MFECSKTPTLDGMRTHKQNEYVHAWGLHEKRLQVAFRGKALTIVSLLWPFAPN